MAGHSKWANIQHRKGAQDAKRGRLFTRLLREVSVAARLGGVDPAANFRLRQAIDKALEGNVPKDTVERAVRRAAGDAGTGNIEEVRYEGYGPGGVAVMVECMTDNRNRTVGEVRHAFSKCGGNLGTDGSVSYLFRKAGQLGFAPGCDGDAVLEAVLEAGAEDVVDNPDGSLEVLTPAERFTEVRDALEARGLRPASAEIAMIPSTTVALHGEEAQRMLKLLELLDSLDDVQDVHCNAEIPDEEFDRAG